MVLFREDSDTALECNCWIIKVDSGDKDAIEFFNEKRAVPARRYQYQLWERISSGSAITPLIFPMTVFRKRARERTLSC